MKKIMAVFIVGILVIGISSVSAVVLPKAENIGSQPPVPISKKLAPRTINQVSTDGSFSGMFAKKNESGYVILGSLEGAYNKSSNYTGSFEGTWNTTDGNASGTMSGWFWGSFILGQIQQDENNSWFVGLYRVNATASEFSAVTLIFGSSSAIRYAAGTYQ